MNDYAAAAVKDAKWSPCQSSRKTIDPAAQPRDIARMVEKLDQFEIQREVTALLDSFEPKVQREIMAGLAERYGFKLMDKQASSGSGPRPTYRKKRTY